MSDSAAPGPGAADALQPDNPNPALLKPDNGSAGDTGKSWLEGLSGDNLKLTESKGWKEGDIDKVLTSYAELEHLRGKSVQIPAEDAPAEEWDAYLSRLPPTMRPPETADKYEFKLPEGLPPDLPYDDTLAKTSKDWMHKAKLNPSQAQAVHDGFVGYMAEQHKAEIGRAAEAVEDTHDVLVKDWGPKDSEGFKKNLELTTRALKNLGLVDVFKQRGILIDDGKGAGSDLTEPQIAKAFLSIGEKMFLEDTIDTTGKPDLGPNPFVKDAKGHRNLTAISKLVKSDPDRAKRQCQEAGEKWSAWAPSNPR